MTPQTPLDPDFDPELDPDFDDRSPLERFLALERPRAGLLARASVDVSGQRHSVESQRGVGEQFAARQEYDLPPERIWIDNAIGAHDSSRAKGVRTEYEKALACIRARGIDVLIMTEISRATRKNREWVELFDECREHEVILAVNGSLYDLTNPDHSQALGLNAVIAVGEVDRLRTRINRGRRSSVLRGSPMGRDLDGYRRLYGKGRLLLDIVEDPVRGPVIRGIFAAFLGGEDQPGRSAYWIAKDLNERGVPSATGAKWSIDKVTRVLRTESYAGRYVWRGKVRAGITPIWPKLIEPEDFDAAQEKLSLRAGGPGHRTSARWFLSGLVVCGVCGGKILMGGPAKYRSYVCKGKVVGGKAGCTAIRTPVGDAMMTAFLVARLVDPRVRELYEASGEDRGRVASARLELAKIRAELEEIEGQVLRGEVALKLASARTTFLEGQVPGLEEAARPAGVNPLVGRLLHHDPEVVVDLLEGMELLEKRELVVALTKKVTLLKIGRAGRHRLDDPAASLLVEWR